MFIVCSVQPFWGFKVPACSSIEAYEHMHCAVVIPSQGRNTTIPTRKTVTLTTHMDWQQSVKLRIFEGERSACQVRNRGRSRSPLGGMAYGSVSIRMLWKWKDIQCPRVCGKRDITFGPLSFIFFPPCGLFWMFRTMTALWILVSTGWLACAG